MAIAFWEVTSAHQVVFTEPLPAGTEIPNQEGAWAVPRMVRTTRFPMGAFLVPTEAREAIHRAAHQARSLGLDLLVAWMWDDGSPPKIGTALFRSPLGSILRFGKPQKPDWFLDLDEIDRAQVPTAWDRLMGDDEL
jgi:hypothetical protein